MKNTEPLLIFDLDGLLVDTEKLFYRAFKSIAKKHGNAPSFQEYTRVIVSGGGNIEELMKLSPEDGKIFRAEVYDKYSNLLDDARLKEGATACLQRLEIYDCVLLTGSKKIFTDYLLDRFHLRKYFSLVITRDDEFPLKPNPAALQHIMKIKDKFTWDCVVIEDSLRGINAAIAIGMPCIFIPTDYTRQKLSNKGVIIVKSLDNLNPEFINRILINLRPITDHTLTHVYRDSLARLDDTYLSYKDIYGLDDYIHSDKDVIPEAFEYAKKRRFFVILILTTRDGQEYFLRSFDLGHLTLIPLGSSIHLEETDTILEAIHRLVQMTLKNARIADIAPLVFLRNRFLCVDGRSVEHIGLGIRALLLNDADDIAKYEKDITVKGGFFRGVPDGIIPQPPARAAYQYFRKWAEQRDYSTYLNEIEGQHAVIGRYQMHHKVIKPLITKLSYIIGGMNIPNMKQEIMNSIGLVKRCIDVACGDDRGIFELSKHIPFVVANDIAVDQLITLEREYFNKRSMYPKSHTLMFTNHDCLDLPFRANAFDVAICRNLLHHMRTAKDLTALLSNMRRIAKRIIIIEVEDPTDGSRWERLRHRYYIDWLKDEGKHFYKRVDFENIINKYYNKDIIEYKYLPTIRGNYMMAIVVKR